jgi:hypothetical protein
MSILDLIDSSPVSMLHFLWRGRRVDFSKPREQGYAEIRAAKPVDDQSGIVLSRTLNVVAGTEAVGTEAVGTETAHTKGSVHTSGGITFACDC